MTFRTCLPSMHLNAKVSLFHVFKNPVSRKRCLIWRSTSEHTFLELEVDWRCSIIILSVHILRINFFYHPMLAVNSIFSTRGFFRMLFMLILEKYVWMCTIQTHTHRYNILWIHCCTSWSLTKKIHSSSRILKIKMMNRRSYDGVRLRRDGRRCFKIKNKSIRARPVASSSTST